MRRLGFLCLSLALITSARATEPRVAPDTIEARAQGCATCHGAHGEGTADSNFPRIAGKPGGYLLNQLVNFRDGRRSYPPMNYLVAYLHDDYLAELAGYFAAQAVQPQAAAARVSAGDAAAGGPVAGNSATERLITHGDAAQGVPACVLCHGADLTGIEPGIPGLIGLSSKYIAAQLVSWRVGTRHAQPPDCMHDVASRLSEAQVRQVADWLASRPADEPAAPAPRGAWKTPLSCGSQP